MGSLARALVLFVVLLLGAVGGAWLSLTLATVLLEPAERNFSNVPFVAALVLLVLGLAFIARNVTGTEGHRHGGARRVRPRRPARSGLCRVDDPVGLKDHS